MVKLFTLTLVPLFTLFAGVEVLAITTVPDEMFTSIVADLGLGEDLPSGTVAVDLSGVKTEPTVTASWFGPGECTKSVGMFVLDGVKDFAVGWTCSSNLQWHQSIGSCLRDCSE